MLLFLIPALGFAFFVCAASVSENWCSERESRYRLRTRFRHWLDTVPSEDVEAAIILGVLVGLVNWLAPKLNGWWIYLAPVFLVGMLLVYGYLLYMWKKAPPGRHLWRVAMFLTIAAFLPTIFATLAAASQVALLFGLSSKWSIFHALSLVAAFAVPAYILFSAVMCCSVKADCREEDNLARVAKYAAWAIAGLLSIMAVVYLVENFPPLSSRPKRVAMPAESSRVTMTEAAKPSAGAQPVLAVVKNERDPRFVQEAIGHENWRLRDDFSVCLGKRAKENKRTTVVPQDTTDEVLSLCGHSAELLKFYASSDAFELCSAELDVNELLTSDGTYLSDKGIALYYQLEGAFKMCKQERAFAPADGYNTGWDSEPVVAESPGVSGDTSSTRYTTPNGYTFDIMDRCANIVFHKPPKGNPPRGKTDNPPPKEDPKKDKTKGTQGNLVASGNNPGPGPSTNNGVGARTSSADEPSKSSSTQTYTEYKEEVKKTNEAQKPVQETQKQSGDSNQPTTTEPSANVDNNGATGNGNGSADTPTPVQPPQNIEEDDTPISTQPGGSLGEPDD